MILINGSFNFLMGGLFAVGDLSGLKFDYGVEARWERAFAAAEEAVTAMK
ncbi:MAG: hypothetical protein JNL18_17020 [Planctomycetaceae bacterium]|nr:hypothetical protein [Planctomycetaceae bacterium]